MFRIKSDRGFSIPEMLISIALVLVVSAVAYKVLRDSSSRQASSISGLKSSAALQNALDRFNRDVGLIDNNWIRYGVAAVYPHQGLGFGDNFYTAPSYTEKLNDGITFLRRDPKNDRIYEFNVAPQLCFPSGLTAGRGDPLFGQKIEMASVDGLAVNDWVLVYQAGSYALGIIELLDSTGLVLRFPSSAEQQLTRLNAANKSTGYSYQPGVVVSNIDYNGNATTTASDDLFCFESGTARLQKLGAPVSYFVDYQTSDGQTKSASNSYVLDSNGNKQKMLVRQEYGPTLTREYLAETDQVEITYDLLGDEIITGSSGQIVKDVGRDKNNSYLLDLGLPVNSTNQFKTTYRIIAVKIKLSNPETENKTEANAIAMRGHEIKVAIDPTYNEEAYRKSLTIDSSMTDELNRAPTTLTEEVGQPLYFVNGVNQEIAVPLSMFDILASGNLGPNSESAIYVYDTNGCPVNPTSGCTPSATRSQIRFYMAAGQTFFPRTLIQVPTATGERIVIGGVAIHNTGPGTLKRKSILAYIDLAPGETLASKLASPLTSGPGTQCNISGCSYQTIDTTLPGMGNLPDTAHIAKGASADELYVTTMTKTANDSSPTALYRGVRSGSSYSFTNLGNILETTEHRVVTAIADSGVDINGVNYLPVCLSRKISDSCGATGCLPSSGGGAPGTTSATDAYGKILLIQPDTMTSHFVANHNYQCSSLALDKKKNLIVSGRLTLQPISYNEMRRAVIDPSGYSAGAHMRWLDEIASVEGGTPRYADYFQVDPATYADNIPQYIGWLTGTSAVSFPDGTFGIASAAKRLLAPGYDINTTGSPLELANAGTFKGKLPGMADYVVATIETNSSNLNASMITASYIPSFSTLPAVYVPGTFLVSGTPRSEPTPLPVMNPTMSHDAWVKMYREFMHAHGGNGLNDSMPQLTGSMTTKNCNQSYPNTCADSSSVNAN